MTCRLNVHFSTIALLLVAAGRVRLLVASLYRRDAGTSAAATINDVLADSFPASDPPPWTPGIVEPAPLPHREVSQSTAHDRSRGQTRRDELRTGVANASRR